MYPSRDDVRENKEREAAELFEAVSHPTRLRILRILSKSPLGFADLKRSLNIKSSGNLSHHLGKMRDLLETDSQGCYAITDRGREALYALERASSNKPTTRLRSPTLARSLALCGIVLMIVGFILAVGVKSAQIDGSFIVKILPSNSQFNVSTPSGVEWDVVQTIILEAINLTDKNEMRIVEPILSPNDRYAAYLVIGLGSCITTLASPIAYIWTKIEGQENRIENLEIAIKRN